MLIDFHTHAFPEKIAAKAIAKLGRDSGLFPHTDGTAASLRALMHRAGQHRGQRMRAAVQTEHHGEHGEKAEAHRELCLTDPKRHRP